MKLLKLKKIISYSTAFLTVFSSISILNCAKVNASPEAYDSRFKHTCDIDDSIKFTQGDLENLIMNFQPPAMGRIPNLANLIKKDRNINHWIGPIQIYVRVTTEIGLSVSSRRYRGLDPDITEDDVREIDDIDSLNIGNLLNEIREVFIEDGIPQETKEEKYLSIIINFLNSKFRAIRLIKENLRPRFEKFESIKTNLLNLLKQTSGAEDINSITESIEEIRKNNSESEIEIMAKIIQDIIVAKRNLYLIRTEASYWREKRKPLYEKLQDLKNHVTNEQKIKPDEVENPVSIIDECEKILEKELELAKREEIADRELLKATEQKHVIEDIPTIMLIDEIERLNL